MPTLFLILLSYLKNDSEIAALRPAHREYLKKFYESKNLLASGKICGDSRRGGVIIGRFESQESAQRFTQNDPFFKENAATYEIIEFEAALFDEILKDYFKN